MQPERRQTFRILVIGALFLAGVYAPTSFRQVISLELQFANLGLLFVLLLSLACRRHGLMGGGSILCSAAIPALMLGFTVLSPLTEFAYGAVLTYGLLALLLALRLDDLVVPPGFCGLLLAVSLANVAAAILLFLDIPAAREFLLDNYSAAYPELVRYMLDEGKPVLSFASHSIAGFYFYLFFFLNLETHRRTRRRLHLAAAIGHLALMMTLTSYTGYLFGIVGLVQLLKQFLWNQSAVRAIAAGLTLLLAAVWLAATVDLDDAKSAFIDRVLTSESSGLSGRYSSSGALAGNLAYIAENPFQPIGLGYSRSLFYGDSGPIEYLTRGSFPLLVAIYTGLYLFLRRNLPGDRDAYWLFGTYMAFEFGYSNLNYFRSLYLLPFVVVYLNSLNRRRAPAYA